jgi:outer membrane beta-barrel protein
VKSKATCFPLIALIPALAFGAEPSGAWVKPLDGVPIDAVETYNNPKAHELSVGMEYFPFNPYYNGLAMSAGYSYRLSQTFAWEILHADYVFAFDKGLTTELADKYSVNPQTIDTLKYMISTNGIYTFSYGKFVLLGDYIRYFRSSVIFGVGLAQTSARSSMSASTGLRLDVSTSERFSWTLEVRDNLLVSGFDNNTSFVLGPSVSF